MLFKKLKSYLPAILIGALVFVIAFLIFAWQKTAISVLEEQIKERFDESYAVRKIRLGNFFKVTQATIENIAMIPDVRRAVGARGFSKETVGLVGSIHHTVGEIVGIKEIYISYLGKETIPFISVRTKDGVQLKQIKKTEGKDQAELNEVIKQAQTIKQNGGGIAISDKFVPCDEHDLQSDLSSYEGMVFSTAILNESGVEVIGVVSTVIPRESIESRVRDGHFTFIYKDLTLGEYSLESLKNRKSDESFYYKSSMVEAMGVIPWELVLYVRKDEVSTDPTISLVYDSFTISMVVLILMILLIGFIFYLQENIKRIRALKDSIKIEVDNRLDHERRLKQFTADAAHELRSPLAIIRGESEVAIRKERSPTEMKDVLESNLVQIKRLQNVIDSLLDLAKVEEFADRPMKKIKMSRLVEQCIESCRANIPVNVKVENSLHPVCEIFGDEHKLFRLFENVITNAIRYSKSDGAYIKLSCQRLSDWILVKVEDNGIGIDEEELPFIFDRFYRSDKVRTVSQEGIGLGLSICKKIVEYHRGEISVSSKKNIGTTIIVKLPRIEITKGPYL